MGLQGDDLREGVVATAKHLVGYGASEGGMNWAPAHIGARELHDVYLHPFEATVRDAGLRSVMNAYNEIDGMPCAADRELLTGLLRDRWGFDGSVVSDYFAVRQIETYHRLADDAPHAAARALDAGIDVELPGTDCYGAPLLEALRSGLVAETILDEAVRRVLATKFELGLFERPFVDVAAVADAIGMDAQRALARTIARKSLVLLKNDGTLPLSTEAQRIAVIGPNADELRHLFGDYSYPAHVESLREMLEGSGNVFSIDVPAGLEFDTTMPEAPTILHALRARLGERVRFARGCDVNTDSREGFDEAVALAAASEIAVMVMGDKAGLTDGLHERREPRPVLARPPGRAGGSRARRGRDGHADGARAGRRPAMRQRLGCTSTAPRCCSPGCPARRAAEAIADALTGDANPGGKLPISFPRSVGQVPVFYGHKVSGGRSHWKGDYVDWPAGAAVPVRPRPQLHALRAQRSRAAATVVGPDGSIELRRAHARTSATAPATRSSSCTCATRRRA